MNPPSQSGGHAIPAEDAVEGYGAVRLGLFRRAAEARAGEASWEARSESGDHRRRPAPP
jgi:hypothetical protein